MPATRRVRRRAASSAPAGANGASPPTVTTETLAPKPDPRTVGAEADEEAESSAEPAAEAASVAPTVASQPEETAPATEASAASGRRGRPRGSKNKAKTTESSTEAADMAALGRLLVASKQADMSVEAYVETLERDLSAYHRVFSPEEG